jgi:hypothetical protein
MVSARQEQLAHIHPDVQIKATMRVHPVSNLGALKSFPVFFGACYCRRMRTATAMRKAKTHFEQVPLETVRKIAQAEALKNSNYETDVMARTSIAKTEPYSVEVGAHSVAKG